MSSHFICYRIRISVVLLGVLFLCMMPVQAQQTAKIPAAPTQETDSLEAMLKLSLSDTTRLDVLKKLAAIVSSQDPLAALAHANEALQIAEQLESTYQRAHVTNIIGNVHQLSSDYKRAMYYYLTALRLLEPGVQVSLQITLLTNIGGCYGALRQYDLAKKYLIRGIAMSHQFKLDRNLGFVYNNLGMIALEQNHVAEAISYFKQSIKEKIPNDKSATYAIIYGNLGDAYMRLNQLSLAESYYEKALQVINPDDSYTVIAYCLSLGKLHLQKKDYRQAAVYLFRARDLSIQSRVHVLTADIYKALGLMYEQQQDFKQAYRFMYLFHAEKDSTTNEKIAHQINEMQARYEVDKKDKEIVLLNQEKEIAKNKAEKERILKGVAVAGIIFMLIISLVVIRVFILKQRVKNKRMAEEKAIMEKDMVTLLHENAEARYEVLKSKTNPHFLFNSLTTLSSIVIEDQPAALTFIQRFSSLYRMILDTGDAKLVSLEDELKLVNDYLYLQKVKFGDNLLVEMNIQPEVMKLQLPPFALQMVVENAAKHNIISVNHPLGIFIYSEGETIVVKNNLRKKSSTFNSTRIGQKNIMERYRSISDKLPEFTETQTDYEVVLPLLALNRQERSV